MSEWLIRWSPVRPSPDVRLFCFPHAGGGAAAYRMWPRLLPMSVDVCAVQLPGRANRMRELAFDDMRSLVQRLRTELLPALDRPFAFFGHSMGAVVAAEVCRLLQQYNDPVPQQLFLSGRRPPRVPDPHTPLRHLTDEEFVVEINRRYGAIPPEIAAEPEVLALLLPGLRADIAALETHSPLDQEPVDCPIMALGGEDDALTPRSNLAAWQHETRSQFQLRMFPGGHFYLDACRQAVVAEVLRTLSSRFSIPLTEVSL